MDNIFLSGLLVIIFIGIPIGLGLICYFLPKRLGYNNTAKYALITFVVVLGGILISFLFEDQLFSENDAKLLVEEQGFILVNEFEIINNESMSAIGEYYHTFTLKIEESDKLRMIKSIKKSDNFKFNPGLISNLYFDIPDRYNGPKEVQNYDDKEFFVREYIKPNGKGYAPTYRRIKVNKKTNELIFEDIDY